MKKSTKPKADWYRFSCNKHDKIYIIWAGNKRTAWGKFLSKWFPTYYLHDTDENFKFFSYELLLTIGYWEVEKILKKDILDFYEKIN